jgi:four helix bundle protein
MGLPSYKDPDVWQASFAFCRRANKLTAEFAADERFGLIDRIRRACVSAPSNFAEGYNRGATRDYVRFLCRAKASTAEIETRLMLARELRFAPGNDIDRFLDDFQRIRCMLATMIRTLVATETE